MTQKRILTEEQKEQRRAYTREYYQRNKEKYAENNKQWWSDLKADPERYDEYRTMVKQYRAEHKEDLTRNMQKYYETHKEEHLAKMRKYYETHKEELKEAARLRRERKKVVDKPEEVDDNTQQGD